MIYTENTPNPPSIHTTLVFKPGGLLDTKECTDAFRSLGVAVVALELDQGPWLACSLDSDGTIRLWPAEADEIKAPLY